MSFTPGKVGAIEAARLVAGSLGITGEEAITSDN
jgi:hypothetical protein